MLRRSREDLKDTIDVARQMYGSAAEWKDKEKQFRFRNGAVFHMAYLENDADAMNYQGWSLTRVYVEELTQYPSSAGIFRLFATLRTTSGARCQFRATCNPGGPGHHWVKIMDHRQRRVSAGQGPGDGPHPDFHPREDTG